MGLSQLNLDSNMKNLTQALYRDFFHDNANMMVTVLPVKKQQDNHNCGHFAVAFDIEILDSKSQIDAVFHVPQLRNQLTHCLESGALAPFPKI